MAIKSQKRARNSARKASSILADWTVVEQDGRESTGHLEPIDLFQKIVAQRRSTTKPSNHQNLVDALKLQPKRSLKREFNGASGMGLVTKKDGDEKRKYSVDERVRGFVLKPVPPFPSKEAEVWKRDAKRLGPFARKYLLDILFEGDSSQQYAALIALRILGDETWAEGYGDDICYFVKHRGRLIRIEPKRHITVREATS